MLVVRTITILRSHSSVVELRITKTLVEPDIELIKANATLKDGSVLYVSEVAGAGFRDYSYHWQKGDKLIKRWDNAPHHKELPNFPHHVHEGANILSGPAVNLTDVLASIEAELKGLDV
ncbi:MAG: hypothetical protein GWP10_20460 [Nitrospiraceae bacterium]|nr:hypothetical protein [Nitrospiraceae bacterium]